MKYTFPTPKKSKNKDGGIEVCDDQSWQRRLQLPAESLGEMEIGEEVTITIKAKVVGLELREREGQPARNEITFDMSSYFIDGKNEFAELAED